MKIILIHMVVLHLKNYLNLLENEKNFVYILSIEYEVWQKKR